MSARRGLLLAVAATVAILGAGCSQEDDSEEPPPVQRLRSEGRLPQKMREVRLEPSMVSQGAQVFAVCAVCHGEKAEGRIGMGPQLISDTFLAAAADELLIRTIAKGREGTTMVPWGESLGEQKILAVVAYLRSLNPIKAVTLQEGPLSGDAARGEALFHDICAGCHGNSGAGYQETANGTGIGRKAFLDEVSNGYLRYIIEHGKSGTKMRPFAENAPTAVANLDKQQIEDVITYIRTNAW